MLVVSRACALIVVALLIGCTGAQPSSSPTASPPPTVAPTAPATAPATTSAAPTPSPTPADVPSPGCCIDPSLSDAGIAARVTIVNDGRAERDGTHDIYGVAADGSECDGSFEEPAFVVVAWDDDAPDGSIHRFGISIGADDIPEADGTTGGITDGSVSFDFVSESGFGTTYTGAAMRENEGSSTISVTRSGSTLTFQFDGVTWDNVSFGGEFVCTNA